ncbi:NADP-dependent oxidoreductase [Deminuibacter soli]|uniref:NADP-dependent oxidoreductase n=1 Tax=Deminuibacter soli TaxID=2291815 RepID=A0A3E1NEQ3_9BACT|nr:NADP-dependent oxidoreductase [Deminuibacter soli]RFM26281.1 NADP-dependent oxidoreductase [Deminuibacter soli]
MKAILLHAAGGPEQVVFEETPDPVLLPGDALVRVLASGTTRNELDWEPTYTDQKGNSRLPSIPGHELCGVVEKLSPGVNGVAVGDEVYALTSFFRNGTAAEYIAVEAGVLAPKPKTLDAVEAASVPLSALTAWQALFDHGNLAAGQKVLIHGAAGGVGLFAVQLARWKGAHVIATASSSSTTLVKSLGAHEVIDYKTQRFEALVKDADLVLDTIGGGTRQQSWKVLKRGGILVSVAGEPIEQPDALPGVKGVFFIVTAQRLQLIEIGKLIDQGIVKPVIATVVPIEQARQAFELGYQPGKQGKIVLHVQD